MRHDDDRGRLEATANAIRRDPDAAAAHVIHVERERDALQDQLTGAVDAIRTLRAYIAAPEGDGPIRYIEALELCDSTLASVDGGQ